MYKQYLKILAKCAGDVFQEMTRTEILSANIKKDERPLSDLPIAHVINFNHMKDEIKGNIILGFDSEMMAVLVASAIAERMGLDPVSAFDDVTKDILNEFINTIAGHTISQWDKLGLQVRFSPPKSQKGYAVNLSNAYHSEAYLIIFSLAVNYFILRVSFIDNRISDQPQKRVLVVDDSMLIRGLLSKTLTNSGFVVENAVNGVDAIEKYKDFKPDLTIMDLIMPEMGGLEAILEIRKINPDSKIVVLTSSSRTDEIVTAQTLNVQEYFIKPVKLPEFVQKISQLLNRD